jgi:hypothetical protein
MQDVELLYLMDNRRRSVGAKRNALLGMAEGEYLSFIDDDDEVATDYVQKIYRTIAKTRKQDTPADVICFPQRATLAPTGVVHECSYSLKNWSEKPPEQRRRLEQSDKENTLKWSGPPAHTMVWRAAIAKSAKFPEKNFQEDIDWVDQVCAKAKHEIQLEGEFLYHYKFSEENTATRG